MAATLAGAASSPAQTPAGMPLGADDTSKVRRRASTSASEWFVAARYGMFITWGLYSDAAGTWKDQRFYGASEWLMKRGRIAAAEYRKLADGFNPTDFDAKAWVAQAKAAGFRYIIITAKHHDGFAIFKSGASAFNSVAGAPFRRDPLRELADETRKAGLKFGVYYSQFQDWTEPDAGGNDWDYGKDRKLGRYMAEKAEPQLVELLTRYGDIAIIWFDTPLDMPLADAQRLYDLVKQHQPDCLVSSRIGHGLGDYQNYRDSEIPQKPVEDQPWEAIFPHADSWGFSRVDNNYKPPSDLIRLLATAASKGGNFLLSAGPDGKGRIPQESLTAFAAVGDWLKVNGAAIYGTSRSPIGLVPFGVVTARDRRLFLHVFHRPDDATLTVKAVNARVLRARVLGGGRLAFRQAGDRVQVDLPERLLDVRNSVIELTLDRPCPDASASPPLLGPGVHLFGLGAEFATFTGGASAERMRYQTYFGVWKHFASIKGMAGPGDSANWLVDIEKPCDFRLSLRYAADKVLAGREGLVGLPGRELPFASLQTGDYSPFNPAPIYRHEIGVIQFPAAGEHRIVLRPRTNSGPLFHFAELVLEPWT